MHAQDEVFDSFLFLSEGALLPSTGIASHRVVTYPCILTPAPLHSYPNSPPQAPLKLPPTHRKQSRPSLYPRCEQAWGVRTPCPFAAHGGSDAVGTPSAPDIYEGTIVLNVL